MLGVLATAGCKKGDADSSGGATATATGDKRGASPKSTTAPAAAPTPETAWLKAKGAQPVAGAPIAIQTPKGETKKENKYGWSISTGPMYFYKMPLDELRASVRYLFEKDGFTVEETKSVGSIEIVVFAKGGDRVSVSWAEQIDSKLSFVSFKKAM